MGRLEINTNIALPKGTEDLFDDIVPDLIDFLIRRVVKILNLEDYTIKSEGSAERMRVFTIYDKISGTRIAKVSVSFERMKGLCRIDIFQ